MLFSYRFYLNFFSVTLNITFCLFSFFMRYLIFSISINFSILFILLLSLLTMWFLISRAVWLVRCGPFIQKIIFLFVKLKGRIDAPERHRFESRLLCCCCFIHLLFICFELVSHTKIIFLKNENKL